MKDTVQVHQVNENTRIAVYYEEYYEGIAEGLENQGVTGIQTIRHHQWLRPIATKDDMADVISRIRYSYEWRYDQDSKTEEVFTRYLKQAGIPFIQKTLRGYSQSEWHDVVIYAIDKGITLENLEAEFESIDAIYKGDVFRLVVEQRVIYTADNGNTIERWEDADYDYEEAIGYDSITLHAESMAKRINADRVAL